MAELTVDGKPFHLILHTLLRDDDRDRDDEIARHKLAFEWVVEHRSILGRILTEAEWKLICKLQDHFNEHHAAVSRDDLRNMLQPDEQTKPIEDVLSVYDSFGEDELTIQPVDSLNVHLDMLKADYERFRLNRALQIAGQITLGSYKFNEPKDTVMKGPRDAIKYLLKRIQEGILLDDQRAEGGLVAETIDRLEGDYEIAEAERLNDTLFIPTGITPIDNNIGGLRRKELNGILGYVAQRKSGAARTIAYNAARAGRRVLHIPLESDCKEEETIYAVMFAQDMGLCTIDSTINKRNVERALLSPGDRKVFFDTVIPGFKECYARNIVLRAPTSRSWQEVKSIIELENQKFPLDLVVIDYLTLLSTPGARDDIADKVMIVQDAKQLAMNINNKRGLCLLSPVQGNRDGFNEAQSNGGAWQASKIYKYSEIEKSLDNCLYVWFNDEMAKENQIVIGSCKTRRDLNIPATFIYVHPASGAFDPKTSDGVIKGVQQKTAASSAQAGQPAPSPAVDQNLDDMMTPGELKKELDNEQ